MRNPLYSQRCSVGLFFVPLFVHRDGSSGLHQSIRLWVPHRERSAPNSLQ